jgi:uncharacterized protein involved in exopolysaccharide biosynthesis
MEEPASSKGQTIADYYIQVEDLQGKFERKNINVKSLNFASLTEGAKHTVQQDSVLYVLFDRINKDINVEKKNKKSTIITLEVVSGDQVFSKTFTEELLKQTSDLYIDIKTGNLSRSINKIQQKADSLQNSLTGIYQKSFQAENATKLYNVNSSLRINTSQTEIAARDKTVSSTLYAEVVKNLETLKLSLINQTPVIQVLDTPKYPLFDQRTPAIYSIIIGFAVGIVLSFFYALYKYTSN